MSEPKQKILVVDDEPDLCEILQEELLNQGYQVKTASNGKAAFDLNNHEVFDLIVSDIRMPGGDGIELLDNIKRKNPFLPHVVLVTGYSDISLQALLNKGANQVLNKPFPLSLLLDCVRTVLALPRPSRSQAPAPGRSQLSVQIKRPNGDSLTTKASPITLGRGGVFAALDTDQFPEPGDLLEYKIESIAAPEALFSGKALCRWVRKEAEANLPAGAGLEFKDLNSSDWTVLYSLLDENAQRAYIPLK